MGKYFLLQLKRFFRILPLAFLVVLLLFGGLMIVLNGVIGMLSDTDSETKVQIAVVGNAEDSFLEMGLTALKSLDSSRFAVEVLSMEEPEAVKALERGQIGAYVVIPEGFMEAALQGRVKTLKFVSTAGAAGMVSMFKSEITTVISDMVLACQKGMFGIENAFSQIGQTGGYGSYMNELSLSYVEFVLIRSKTYRVEELGITDELGFEGNLFCGICVLFLTLAVLPYSPLLIKRDVSVDRILLSKRYGVIGQVLCEFGAFLICFAVQALLICICVIPVGKLSGLDMSWLMGKADLTGIVQLLAVVLMISAFGYMLFGFSTNMVGGVLLQFFVGLFLCFVSGCMYPSSFFPEVLQSVSGMLPHGIARMCIVDCFLGVVSDTGIILVLMSVLFLAVATCLRKHRLTALGG